MSLLSFDVASCVHTSNKFAICDACVDSCPVETLKFDQFGVISFTPSDCVGCGGCLASCPTDSFKLDDFNPLNFIFSFLESKQDILTCNESDLPCIAALSVEQLLSLTLISSKELTLDVGPCSDCEIAHKNLEVIEDNAQELNFLLEAMLQDKSIKLEKLDHNIEENQKDISRRELFSKNGIKTILSAKAKFHNRVDSEDTQVKTHKVLGSDIAKIKDKKIPDSRSLLMMAMKRADVPKVFHTIESEDISFISQKVLDEDTCTNCQMCYRICPTGALKSDYRGSFINFDPLACVKCHSCHDVCEPDSLRLSKTFNLVNLFEQQTKTLVRFTMKRCDECGTFFSYEGGEVMCKRCKIEEEEARALWGIK